MSTVEDEVVEEVETPRKKVAPKPKAGGKGGRKKGTKKVARLPVQAKVNAAVVKKETETKAQRRKRLVQESKEKEYPIVHDRVSVKIFGGNEKDNLTVGEAMKILSWEEEPDGVEWSVDDTLGTGYNKKKFRCLKNPTNRPFRLGLAKRYASEYVRGKWKLNGETIVVNDRDLVQDGQHRLIGLVLAEQLRQLNPDKWADHYGLVDEVSIPVLLVYGISSDRDTSDSQGIGQKRSLGDVFFRDKRFQGDDVDTKKLKLLSNVLAGAVRLVWIRAGGKKVSDAQHFPHSEAIDFLDDHPKIKDAVEYIDLESRQASAKYIQPAYAAALLYLMAASRTEPEEYAEEGAGAVDLSLWKKACEFWSEFYYGNLQADHPIRAARDIVQDIEAASGSSRDEIVGTIVKAFNLWVDGKKSTTSKLRIERDTDYKLMEEPRLGGLDIAEPVKATGEDEPEKEEKKPPKVKRIIGSNMKGSKKGKKWAEGDTAWVTSDPDDLWFGEIILVADDGKSGVMRNHADDEEWEVNWSRLSLVHPSKVK